MKIPHWMCGPPFQLFLNFEFFKNGEFTVRSQPIKKKSKIWPDWTLLRNIFKDLFKSDNFLFQTNKVTINSILETLILYRLIVYSLCLNVTYHFRKLWPIFWPNPNVEEVCRAFLVQFGNNRVNPNIFQNIQL